jgi:hypothetical protein
MACILQRIKTFKDDVGVVVERLREKIVLKDLLKPLGTASFEQVSRIY